MYTNDEIRNKYRKYARHFDQYVKIPEHLLFKKRRQRLLQYATGNVLEVAVGTGVNMPYYPEGCTLTGLDYSPEMLTEAKKKVNEDQLPVNFIQGNAESLPFETDQFNTVVSTLSLCTFPHPVQALVEMQRVCKPDGRILLFEHGRSRWSLIGSFQDQWAEQHAKAVGCYWNRHPLQLVKESGMEIQSVRSSYGDFLVEMIGKPKL